MTEKDRLERDQFHERFGGMETKINFIYEFFKKDGLVSHVAINTDSIKRLWRFLLALFVMLGGAVWSKWP